jgi:spore germination protein KB
MEKGKISSLQMALMIYPAVMATIILSVPSITAKYAATDFWISPIIAAIPGFATVYIVYKLHELYPKQTVIQYSEEIIGKYAGKIIGFIILFYGLSSTGHVVRQYSDIITNSFLDKTPAVVIISTMIFTCALAVRGGIEVLGRASQIFVPLFILPQVVIILLLLPQFEYRNIFPILADGILPPMKGAIMPSLWFTQLFLLSFFFPFLVDVKKGKKYSMLSIVAIMVSLIIVDLAVLFILGPSVHTKLYPLMDVIKYIRIGEFFENLEAIIMAIWIVGTFVKISVFYYALALGTAQWLNLSSYRSIVWPLGILITIFSFWSLPSSMALGNLTSVVPMGYFVHIMIPLLLLGVALIRKRSQKRKVKETG